MNDRGLPDRVCEIMTDKGVSLIAAWRIYRGLSEFEVARALCVSINNFKIWEKTNDPCQSVLLKLATLYSCSPAELID